MIIRDATIDDLPAIAQIHISSWQSTYQGILPDSYLASLSTQSREERWTKILNEPDHGRTIFTLVAEETDVFAFANGGPIRSDDADYDCEIYAIYIHESHQRRGIGRELMRSLADKLSQAGFQAALVWVLTENPSRCFYESLGGKIIRSSQIRIGGTPLEEIAYGWPDIHTLQTV